MPSTILYLAAAIVGLLLGISPLLAQDTVEVRAGKVCAGLGQSEGEFQGTFKVGDVSISGDADGTVKLSRAGVDLGKIEKATYAEYTNCLVTVIKLLMEPPPISHPAPSPAQYKVCFGNGGGNNCYSGASASYSCDVYNNQYGGGAPLTYTKLAEQFCSYKSDGQTILGDSKITVYQNNGGGQCGWTGFLVSCY